MKIIAFCILIRLNLKIKSLKCDPLKGQAKTAGLLPAATDLTKKVLINLKQNVTTVPPLFKLDNDVTDLSSSLSQHLLVPFIMNQRNSKVKALTTYGTEQLKNRKDRKPGLMSRLNDPDFTIV